MSTTVFLVVLGAAILHALWNALVKGAADKSMTMGAVVLGHMPFALIALIFAPAPDLASLPWLIAGMALHGGYQLFLLRAYESGDLTQVYPIARGVAPLIVALVSVAFLGVHLLPMEVTAILVIAAGIFSLMQVRRTDGQRNIRAALLALMTGCFIAAYSLVDGYGARIAGTSLGFYAWEALGNGIIVILSLRLTMPGTLGRIALEGRRLFMIGGSASFAAYALVTWAFTQAPIALVTALRETSIIFVLLIGVFVLRERLDLAKLGAIIATLTGVALMRYTRH